MIGEERKARRTSLVVRVVVAVTAMSLLAIAVLFAVTDRVIRSESDAALRRAVDVEIAALADIFASGGEAELVARIRDRLNMRAVDDDQTHYLLMTAGGERLAGDIPGWPKLSARDSEARFVTLAGGTPVFARATQLDGRLRLVAARTYQGWTMLRRRLALAFAGAGLAVVLTALGLAWVAAARLRNRVASMNTAFDSYERAGAGRVPGVEHRDELGELAIHANQLLQRLEAALSAQRDVTDQVAHEIRTPLVHLDAALLRLIGRAAAPDQIAELGAVRQEARRIGDLLDSLLDIAASEARVGDRSSFAAVNVSEVAEQLAELYQDSASELNLEFRTAIAPNVSMYGEAMHISRAISNLLDNAFKYAGAGATVRLSVEHGPRITVEDTGPGVPEDARARLFERFQRGYHGERVGRGHGLGLALVRAIARRHALDVSYEDVQPGARFTIAKEESG